MGPRGYCSEVLLALRIETPSNKEEELPQRQVTSDYRTIGDSAVLSSNEERPPFFCRADDGVH
jgi:hypothetical protein